MMFNGGDVNYNKTICAVWKFIIQEDLNECCFLGSPGDQKALGDGTRNFC